MPTAIACASGAFRGVFTHGVLSAFEASGLRADAYAAASSTVVPAALAATGQLDALGGAAYWRDGIDVLRQLGDISQMILRGIAEHGPRLRGALFEPEVPRFLIVASAVVTGEAAELTQGPGARRLGQKLLLAMRTGDRSWADEHLAPHLYDTAGHGGVDLRLAPENLEAVAYASTRMLHAWKTPAWIDGRPYVDASYTCACPAVEMVGRGYDAVIAISPEPGPIYRDLFRSETIPAAWRGVPIHIVQPDVDLGSLGVDFTAATPGGLEAAFRHGEAKGRAFLMEQDRT